MKRKIKSKKIYKRGGSDRIRRKEMPIQNSHVISCRSTPTIKDNPFSDVYHLYHYIDAAIIDINTALGLLQPEIDYRIINEFGTTDMSYLTDTKQFLQTARLRLKKYVKKKEGKKEDE